MLERHLSFPGLTICASAYSAFMNLLRMRSTSVRASVPSFLRRATLLLNVRSFREV